MKNKKMFSLTVTALLSACAIALSYLESLIPDLCSFLPGGKIGLSNIAVLISALMVNFTSGFMIVLIKSFFSLITRGFVSGVLSFFGGAFSCIAMYLIVKYDNKFFGYFGIGIIGAVINNFVQILIYSVLYDNAIFYYLPYLLLLSIASGSVTGLAFGILIPRLLKLDKQMFFVKEKNKC